MAVCLPTYYHLTVLQLCFLSVTTTKTALQKSHHSAGNVINN